MIKYGFLTDGMSFNNMSGLLYILQNLKVYRDESQIKFSSDTEEFIFSNKKKFYKSVERFLD